MKIQNTNQEVRRIPIASSPSSQEESSDWTRQEAASALEVSSLTKQSEAWLMKWWSTHLPRWPRA